MPSRQCRVESVCTTETNFCSESKDMPQLSVVRYQVLRCKYTYNTDAIAINKL